MSLPKIELTGVLTDDATTREVKSGHMVKARIRTTRNKKNDAGKWEVIDTLFLDVIAFSAFAEDDARRLAVSKKGDRVTISGVLADNSWEKRDGTKVTAYQVKVATVELPKRP